MKYRAGKLTRPYVACQLLAIRPMRLREIAEETGWTPKVTDLVTGRLMKTGDVIPVNRNGKRHYALASWKPSESSMPSTLTTQTGHLTDTQGSCHG